MHSEPDVIEKEIVVRTTPEKAFRALTSEEEMRRWWVIPPGGTTVKFPARNGASYEMTGRNGPGPDWTLKGKITAFEPNRHLAYTWGSTWTAAETLVEWWIDDLGDGSVKIRLRHSGWNKEPDKRATHEDGWSKILPQLEDYLAGREVVVRMKF